MNLTTGRLALIAATTFVVMLGLGLRLLEAPAGTSAGEPAGAVGTATEPSPEIPSQPATNTETDAVQLAMEQRQERAAAVRAAALKRAQARARAQRRARIAALERESAQLGLAVGQRASSHTAAVYRGTGSRVYVPGTSPMVGFSGRRFAYAIQVEDGLNVDAQQFASTVEGVLGDERSWIGHGAARFERVNPGSESLRIVLASPALTDRLCAPLSTDGIYSCRSGSNVVINYYRWVTGARAYPGDLDSYRTYLINHEVGHGIGMDHIPCAGNGMVAAVMLQQSIGLGGCQANPWPRADEAARLTS